MEPMGAVMPRDEHGMFEQSLNESDIGLKAAEINKERRVAARQRFID